MYKKQKAFFKKHKVDINAAAEFQFNPYFRQLESSLANPVRVEGKVMYNLAANNYLGLAQRKEIKEQQKKAIDIYGASLCGTPIATGTTDLAKKTEERLSKFAGLESGIIFPSCYQANMSIFSCITGNNTVIIFDHYCHASLIQGIQKTSAKIKPFLHNNTQHLEKTLAHSQDFEQIIVVTESVFSTEGSCAPFYEIVQLCDKYDAIPIVDDSHGIGVLGPKGKGVLRHFQIKNYKGIYTASLGKAMANSGGYVGGPKELIDYLKYNAGAYIYSTALPPSLYAGTLEALRILEGEGDALLAQLKNNTARLRKVLDEKGLPLVPAEASIVSIDAGSLKNAARIGKALFKAGLFVTLFIPPSVPNNKSKIRLIAGADIHDEMMDTIIQKIKDIRFGT